jgi:hypothetical protein
MLESKNKKAMDQNGKTLKNQSRQIIINVWDYSEQKKINGHKTQNRILCP